MAELLGAFAEFPDIVDCHVAGAWGVGTSAIGKSSYMFRENEFSRSMYELSPSEIGVGVEGLLQHGEASLPLLYDIAVRQSRSGIGFGTF